LFFKSCFKKFRSLDDRVGKDRSISISKEKLYSLPELAENPLKDRIVRVFSSDKENDRMCFEDFLNMFSVFSEAAPNSVKYFYAFEIYDFHNRERLLKEDVAELIKRLIGDDNSISRSDMDVLVDKVCILFDYLYNNRPFYLKTL
jgi:Ca2+-binding EF-hand superfamily protein